MPSKTQLPYSSVSAEKSGEDFGVEGIFPVSGFRKAVAAVEPCKMLDMSSDMWF